MYLLLCEFFLLTIIVFYVDAIDPLFVLLSLIHHLPINKLNSLIRYVLVTAEYLFRCNSQKTVALVCQKLLCIINAVLFFI